MRRWAKVSGRLRARLRANDLDHAGRARLHASVIGPLNNWPRFKSNYLAHTVSVAIQSWIQFDFIADLHDIPAHFSAMIARSAMAQTPEALHG
jgi:hypothetical protein